MSPRSTGILIGFALCGALVIGFVGGSQYRLRRWPPRVVHANAPRNVSGLPDSVLRARDPLKWQRDSVAHSRWAPTHSSPPREVSHTQTFGHCSVAFEIRDTIWGKNWLVSAEARSARSPGLVLSKGWTYTTKGFQVGDTVIIVIPNVFCSDIVITSTGGSLVVPRPLQLEVR